MIESGRSSLSGRERDGATASGAVGPPGTSTARCPALRARATGAVRLASGRGPQGPGPGEGAAPRGGRGRSLALGARGPRRDDGRREWPPAPSRTDLEPEIYRSRHRAPRRIVCAEEGPRPRSGADRGRAGRALPRRRRIALRRLFGISSEAARLTTKLLSICNK